MSGRTIQLVVVGAMLAGTLIAESGAAETHKDFHFNVGPKAGVSVNNPYGSISVKPSSSIPAPALCGPKDSTAM